MCPCPRPVTVSSYFFPSCAPPSRSDRIMTGFGDYTPTNTTTPSSTTPQRMASTHIASAHPIPHLHDYTPPSAYLHHDPYTGPNTPHAEGYDHSGMPSTTDDTYGFAYGDFSMMPVMDDPSGAAAIDEEATPMMSETQPIPPSMFPCPPSMIPIVPPHMATDAAAHNAALMSPFRTMPHSYEHVPLASPHGVSYHITPPGYIDPNSFQQQYVHAPTFTYTPQYAQVYPPYTPVQELGPPRSSNGSPTSSISSSHASLHRSGSTTSDVRTARPKVKLTFDDKRQIVELHRSNSSLRQEDIARQYG